MENIEYKMQVVGNVTKTLLEAMELIEFRIAEVLDKSDYEKTFPKYQEMLSALRDIRKLTA